MRHWIVGCILFCALSAQAQDVFEGGLVVGGNMSQIEGDYLAGYKKLGGWAGLRVATRITPKERIVLEMLYSMRGARSGRYETEGRQSINTASSTTTGWRRKTEKVFTVLSCTADSPTGG
jgi:hypothetical protein